MSVVVSLVGALPLLPVQLAPVDQALALEPPTQLTVPAKDGDAAARVTASARMWECRRTDFSKWGVLWECA